jgi:hypothetical protein
LIIFSGMDVPCFAWTDQNEAVLLGMRRFVSIFLRTKQN